MCEELVAKQVIRIGLCEALGLRCLIDCTHSLSLCVFRQYVLWMALGTI